FETTRNVARSGLVGSPLTLGLATTLPDTERVAESNMMVPSGPSTVPRPTSTTTVQRHAALRRGTGSPVDGFRSGGQLPRPAARPRACAWCAENPRPDPTKID